MSAIGLMRDGAQLVLHSCASCGRHAWREDGREVDRDGLLGALRASTPPPAARRKAVPPPEVPPPAVPPPASAPARPPSDADRRSELQHLLSGFQVHGTTG